MAKSKTTKKVKTEAELIADYHKALNTYQIVEMPVFNHLLEPMPSAATIHDGNGNKVYTIIDPKNLTEEDIEAIKKYNVKL